MGMWWLYDTARGAGVPGLYDTEFEAHMRCAILNAEHDDATSGNVTLSPHL
jgi:hypothetical protein